MLDADYCEIQVGGHQRNSQRRGVALVDVADAKAVGAYAWHMSNGYAMRRVGPRGKVLRVLMHRQLLGLTPDDPRSVDHINGDPLDNRRTNLRVCTHAQNLQNLHDRPYRGTSWEAQTQRYKAQAQLNGRNHNLGRFATREEAAAVAAAFRRERMPYSADAREQPAGRAD